MLFEGQVRELESDLRLADASKPDDCSLLTTSLYEELLFERINLIFTSSKVFVLKEWQVY
jgi:hypothetical protein